VCCRPDVYVLSLPLQCGFRNTVTTWLADLRAGPVPHTIIQPFPHTYICPSYRQWREEREQLIQCIHLQQLELAQRSAAAHDRAADIAKV
jgi:hypothetical protein